MKKAIPPPGAFKPLPKQEHEFDAAAWQAEEYMLGAEEARQRVGTFGWVDTYNWLETQPPDWPNGHWVRGFRAYLDLVKIQEVVNGVQANPDNEARREDQADGAE